MQGSNVPESEQDFKVGEVVWAKMRGYPHWPGQITPLNDSPFPIRKGAYCVYFFGTRNYAPIFPEDIKPFHELDADQMKVKHLQMNKAIIECEKFLAGKIRIFHEHNKKELLLYEGMFSIAKEARASGSSSPDDSTDNFCSSTRSEKEASKSSPQQLPGKDGKVNGMSHEDVIEKVPLVNLHQCEMLTEDQVLCLANKEVKPTEKPIGFLGLGCLGRAVVRNLLLTKHSVTVWNRNGDVSREFERLGAIVGNTPKDLVNECQIIFICLSDSAAVSDLMNKEIFNLSVLKDKCFVQMSCVNPATAMEISKIISLKGGRFLMTSVIGTKAEIHVGDMVVLASGDRVAKEECDSCFHAICGVLHYLGENVSTAITLGASLNYLRAASLGALAETLSLAEKIGLSQTDFLQITDYLKLLSPFQKEAASKMINGCFITQRALQHVTNDLKIVVDIAEMAGSEKMQLMNQLLQMFKIAQSIGLKDHDESSIYLKAQTQL